MTPDVTPDPTGPDDEVQAAAQRLTQDFLCHVIQEEEEGWGKKAEDEGKARAEGLGQGPPLGAILGNLPSLDLQQDLEDCAEPEGETRTSTV